MSHVYGFYYRFNNLRLKQTQNISDASAAHVVVCCASSGSWNVSRKKAYTRSPLQDSRLFGPSPWKILATTYETNGFLSNPASGENLESGNLVMETGCTGRWADKRTCELFDDSILYHVMYYRMYCNIVYDIML